MFWLRYYNFKTPHTMEILKLSLAYLNMLYHFAEPKACFPLVFAKYQDFQSALRQVPRVKS